VVLFNTEEPTRIPVQVPQGSCTCDRRRLIRKTVVDVLRERFAVFLTKTELETLDTDKFIDHVQDEKNQVQEIEGASAAEEEGESESLVRAFVTEMHDLFTSAKVYGKCLGMFADV
jgi:hypothetical protein